MFRPFTVALALLATPLAAQDEHAGHVAEAHGLHLLHPWTRATNGDTALVFVEIANEGRAAVTLTGASSPAAADGMLAGFRLGEGEGSYEAVGTVPLRPGASLELAPEQLVIRLDGLTQPLQKGGHLDVVLDTSAGPVAFEASIEAATARHHSHAGHAH
jgi:copper(I)-binding protein